MTRPSELRGDTPSILRAAAEQLVKLSRLRHVDEEVGEVLGEIAGIVRIEALRVEAGSTEDFVPPGGAE